VKADVKLMRVTFFRNKSAATLEARDMSLEELYELIIGTNRESKGELPLLKCATFGDERTDKGSLRHDANVNSISGLEADYDGEEMSFEEAIEIVEAARLNALLYTSPSNSKEKPRWRVVCPTSCDLPPEERTKLVGRLNGILGSILAPESFTLSQSYYYGSVNNSAEHRGVLVKGDCIDLRDDLDDGAIGKSKKNADRLRGFEAHRALLGDGPGLEGFNGPLCSATASYGATHAVDFDRDKLKELLRGAIERAPKPPGRPAAEIKRYLGDAHLDNLIASAIDKFGMSDDVARLNALHAVLPIGGKTRVVTFGELEEFPGRTTIILTQTLGDFRALQNKYHHEYTDAKGGIKSIPLGTYWLGSRNRRQYDGGMAFMPRHSDNVVGDRLNLWHGYGVKPVKPDRKSGAAGCDKFLGFMCEVICSDNEEHFDYLRKREAFILQERRRSEIALGLRTEEEGVGKGFFEKHLRRLYGDHAMQITNPSHIIGKFNPHLETLLRMTADEALFVGDPRHRNALFSLITEETISIEPKNCGVYTASNYLNISITSNATHFIPVSGTARRFFVPTVSSGHKQDFDYFRAIEDQLVNDGGYQALLYHLLYEVDLRDFEVRKVPKTAGLASRQRIAGVVLTALSKKPAARHVSPTNTQSGRGLR
jgi:hypothetical protein